MTCSRQQLTAMLLLVVVVAALLPMPTFSVVPVTFKDRSRPFPCQDRPCGCRSADQCKKKCCCFSAAQKLAWAKLHGVKACEVVAESGKCETETVSARKQCCFTDRPETSGRVKEAVPVRTRQGSKPRMGGEARYQIVIGAFAQECHGVAQSAFGQSVFVIPPIVTLMPLAEPTGERFLPEGMRLGRQFADPPVPPPRLIADKSSADGVFML